VVVRDKDKGAVLEAPAGKRIVNGYHAPIANALPRLDGPNGLLIGQTETYTGLTSEFQERLEIPAFWCVHTFKSSESIEIAIFAGLGFVNPAWVSESCGILLMAEIQWD
jgi:hypothetical protein